MGSQRGLIFTFLCYWTDEGKKIDAVVVKKSGTPMIYKTKDYTMVVAIDCVKIGFIFRNGKNQHSSENGMRIFWQV